MAILFLHMLVAVCLIVAYVIVTVTGHDGNALLGILVGYLGGASAERSAQASVRRRRLPGDRRRPPPS